MQGLILLDSLIYAYCTENMKCLCGEKCPSFLYDRIMNEQSRCNQVKKLNCCALKFDFVLLVSFMLHSYSRKYPITFGHCYISCTYRQQDKHVYEVQREETSRFSCWSDFIVYSRSPITVVVCCCAY